MRLAEAQAEKVAVMAAGEVLLSELEQLGDLHDDAIQQLAGAQPFVSQHVCAR